MKEQSNNHNLALIDENSVFWWKAIVESINDGVLVIDHDGYVRMINPEYTRITGVTPDIIGKPLTEYRPGSQLPKTLKDRQCRVGVYRKTEDREYVVDMAPIIVNEQIIGAVSVCKSLTEVHKLSLELQKQNEKVRQLEKQMNAFYKVKYTFDDIIGKDGGLKDVVYVAKRVSDSNLPILITGESGTGKELFAQAIHHNSSRGNKPFIPVNCASIPPSLLESELFGYGEGAFTNAKKGGKVGLFEMADQGTLFLDEIGDMPYDLQAKLLRVLQESKVRRVGETEERNINVRIIAATHRDLQQLVNKNRFRDDLFYRLNVICLHIAPLRERREDIPELIHSLLHSSRTLAVTDRSAYTIDKQTLEFMRSYDWPGNVRELKNVIDYATCITEGTEIKLHHLPSVITKHEMHRLDSMPKPRGQTLKDITEEAELKYIKEVLGKFGDDMEGRKKAAKSLGISLATLYNKMKKYRVYQ